MIVSIQNAYSVELTAREVEAVLFKDYWNQIFFRNRVSPDSMDIADPADRASIEAMQAVGGFGLVLDFNKRYNYFMGIGAEGNHSWGVSWYTDKIDPYWFDYSEDESAPHNIRAVYAYTLRNVFGWPLTAQVSAFLNQSQYDPGKQPSDFYKKYPQYSFEPKGRLAAGFDGHIKVDTKRLLANITYIPNSEDYSDLAYTTLDLLGKFKRLLVGPMIALRKASIIVSDPSGAITEELAAVATVGLNSQYRFSEYRVETIFQFEKFGDTDKVNLLKLHKVVTSNDEIRYKGYLYFKEFIYLGLWSANVEDQTGGIVGIQLPYTKSGLSLSYNDWSVDPMLPNYRSVRFLFTFIL